MGKKKNMGDKYCVILTTCDNKEIANKITSNLLEKRLVSCVQSTSISSSYHWKGKIENANEILLQMKSKKALYKEIEKEILLLHNYECPQIIAIDMIDGYLEYLNWIDNETK